MTQIALDVVVSYISGWIYYLLHIFWWTQAGFLSALFAAQCAEEAFVLKGRFVPAAARLGGAVLFLFLFGASARALADHPLEMDQDTYWGLGLVAEENGSYDKAVKWFSRAEKSGQRRESFYLEYAEAYHRLDRNREALLTAKKCPGESAAENVMLGRIYYSLGKYKAAESALKTALAKSPQDFTAAAWLGQTYLALGRRRLAARIFSMILQDPRLNPKLRQHLKNQLIMSRIIKNP